MVNIPHFDLPFNFGPGAHANVVEQDGVEDVTNCVQAVLLTEKGSRLFVPDFGIDDPTFLVQPLDLIGLQREIVADEPRANLILSGGPDSLDSLIADITVGVQG